MLKKQQLTDLKKDVSKKFAGRNIVEGSGKPTTGIMLITDMVTADEEKKRKLIVGQHGKVFNGLLKEHGVRRSNFYVTPAVKFRPDNGLPTPKEIKQSSFFLKQEIKIIEPKLIVALGSVALRGLGVKLPMGNIRGRLVRFGEMNLFATHAPSDLIKNPLLQSEARLDFHKLKEIIEELNHKA